MTISEEKLLNAIKFFIKNTRNVGRTKLFKLLFFLDFIHFKKHGLSVTGLDYYTYDFGPVPQDLYKKIIDDNLPTEFLKDFKIIEEKQEEDNFKQFKFVLKNKNIDLDWFTPYEIKVLNEVAEIFKYATAKDMTEITHLKNTPWYKTLEEKGSFQKIDYFLAIDDDTTLDIDIIKERFKIQKELLEDGRL